MVGAVGVCTSGIIETGDSGGTMGGMRLACRAGGRGGGMGWMFAGARENGFGAMVNGV